MSNRWRTQNSEVDNAPAVDGDTAWTGVNAKLAPDKLAPGMASAATNKLFGSGAAETRGGTLTPVAHRSGAVLLFGSGIYSDPNGVEWIAQVAAGVIHLTRDGSSRRTVTIPGTVTTPTDIVQAFNVLLAFRGEAVVPWSWSGSNLSGFAAISQTTSGSYTSPIPNAVTAELMNNRLIVPAGRDQLAVSELLDYTRYDAALSDFNVNSGSDDRLVRAFPFTDNTLLVFKDQSIHLISNLYGNLSEIRLDPLNGELGCSARKSVAMVGGDAFFLSATGVFRIQQVIQGRLQSGAVPVSDPIEPIIQRITSRHISTSVAAVLGRYYYLAVPIDGATRPNAMLVYDTVSQAWQGIHTWPSGVAFDNLLVTDWNGRKRLHGIDHTNARVHLLYEGRTDRIVDTEYAISDSITSRGYLLGDSGVKQFRRATVNLSTWDPSITIDLVVDGQNETKQVTSAALTKSRTNYYTFATPAWVESNVNNDHANPKREDYSIDFDTAIDPGAAGLDPDRKQTALERRNCKVRARWAAIRVANSNGLCDVQSVEIEGDPAGRAVKTHA